MKKELNFPFADIVTSVAVSFTVTPVTSNSDWFAQYVFTFCHTHCLATIFVGSNHNAIYINNV